MPEPAAVGPTRIGIDLGGTKIEAAALSPGGVILARHRVATPRDDYQATLVAIAGLVERLEERIGHAASVGVGMPGMLSPATGLVKVFEDPDGTSTVPEAVVKFPSAEHPPAENLGVMKVKVTGLKPDTKYFFQTQTIAKAPNDNSVFLYP